MNKTVGKISKNYKDELIQVAAVAMVALQDHETGSTDIIDFESWMSIYARRVYRERMRQETMYGPREGRLNPRDWLTILIREVGEVAEEI